MDTSETPQQSESSKPPLYLIYVFGVGIASIVLMLYWGYIGFSFWIAAAVGGGIQVIFRTSKRMWSNSLSAEGAREPEVFEQDEFVGEKSQSVANHRNPVIKGIVDTIPTFQVFAFLYGAMVIVSALWYGLGRLFGWIFS